LTTSKTKNFCETSSIFEVDDIKNERLLRDFLQKWKDQCSADTLVPMRFAIFLLHLSKVLRLPRKIDASTLLQSEGSEGGQRAFVKEVNDIYGSQVNGRSWPPGTAELGWLCGISGV
jgi:hypothetical protein